MKKLGLLLGIFMIAGSISEVNAQCWIDKRSGKYDYETIGKARPVGADTNDVWIDKRSGKYDYETIGRIRANGNEDCLSTKIVAAAAYLLLTEDFENQ